MFNLYFYIGLMHQIKIFVIINTDMAFLSQVGGNKRMNQKGGQDTPAEGAITAFTRELSAGVSQGDATDTSDLGQVTSSRMPQFPGVSKEMEKILAKNKASNADEMDNGSIAAMSRRLGLTGAKPADKVKANLSAAPSDNTSDDWPGTKPAPTNKSEVTELVNKLAEAVSKAARPNGNMSPTSAVTSAVKQIAEDYQKDVINVGAIVDAWEQLKVLGLANNKDQIAAAIAVGKLYDGKGVNVAGNFDANISLRLDGKKRRLTNLSQQLMNTQYQLIKVTQQIDENLSRASKIKKILENAPVAEQAALNVALAQHVKAVNQYQPSWYLLDNLTQTLKHQMHNATLAAGLPLGELAAYSEPPFTETDQVLSGLMDRYGSDLMRKTAEGIQGLAALPTYTTVTPAIDDTGMSVASIGAY